MCERSLVSLPTEPVVSHVCWLILSTGCACRHLSFPGVRTSWTFDGYNPGSDVDLDIFWDNQLLFGKDVLHLEQWWWVDYGCMAKVQTWANIQ